jgi:hypothetical protein
MRCVTEFKFFHVTADGTYSYHWTLKGYPCVSHYLALVAAKHIFLLVPKHMRPYFIQK